MDGRAEPVITWPAPALILSNAGKGAAHTGFDRAFADLVSTARTFGLAAFAQRNAYTCGALGWFVSRLANEGLVGLAAANTHAMITVPGVTKPVYGTNPLAFAAPVGARPPAGPRPGLQRDRLRQHPQGDAGRPRPAARLGDRCRGPADHRARPPR